MRRLSLCVLVSDCMSRRLIHGVCATTTGDTAKIVRAHEDPDAELDMQANVDVTDPETEAPCGVMTSAGSEEHSPVPSTPRYDRVPSMSMTIELIGGFASTFADTQLMLSKYVVFIGFSVGATPAVAHILRMDRAHRNTVWLFLRASIPRDGQQGKHVGMFGWMYGGEAVQYRGVCLFRTIHRSVSIFLIQEFIVRYSVGQHLSDSDTGVICVNTTQPRVNAL